MAEQKLSWFKGGDQFLTPATMEWPKRKATVEKNDAAIPQQCIIKIIHIKLKKIVIWQFKGITGTRCALNPPFYSCFIEFWFVMGSLNLTKRLINILRVIIISIATKTRFKYSFHCFKRLFDWKKITMKQWWNFLNIVSIPRITVLNCFV